MFLIAVAFVYAVVALYSVGYLRPGIGHIRLRRWYWPLLDAFGLALLATPIVANLGVMWVAVELTTVVSALLVTAEGSEESLEARWKYIVIGSAGLAVGLFGSCSSTRRGVEPWRSLRPPTPRLPMPPRT